MSMRGGMRVDNGGLWRPRTRAVERRATETEADRATRELAWRLSAPAGRLVSRNYKGMASGEKRPGRAIERRLRECAREGVPVGHAIDAMQDWAVEIVCCAYRAELADARHPTPTAPAARSKAA